METTLADGSAMLGLQEHLGLGGMELLLHTINASITPAKKDCLMLKESDFCDQNL